jgi:membrane associated rhomboid family serine protease
MDQALERIAKLETSAPVELSPIASELVARIEAAPLPSPIKVERAPIPWATWSLTVALLGVAGVIALLGGTTSDPGVLVRSGAMVRGLIDSGETWRLVSCVFIHVGAVHLAVNVVGIFFLGRITEELFGTARTFALFGLCGIAGSFASYLASPAGVSAGASGAIFGILGAVFVELTWHRRKYRAAWRRGLWGGLVVVTVAQLAVGFLYPVIDQWAHGAGLAGGIAFGTLLSPSWKYERLAKYTGRALAALFAAATLGALVLTLKTSIADSLGNMPSESGNVAGVHLTAPSTYVVDRVELVDADGIVLITVHREPLSAMAPQMASWVAETAKVGKARGFDDIATPPSVVVPLPDGWEGAERIGSFDDAMGNRQHYRVVIAGKDFGGTLVQLTVMTPDSIARSAPGFFTKLIASAKPES